jgi:ANTAR domain-containing protein/GAF domain-containing protein
MTTTDGGARQLAMKFAQMSRTMLDQPSVERTLQGIVELAARTVDGAASAGITVVSRDKRLVTRAYTDELVLKVDQAQSRLREGPCLSAGELPNVAVFRIDDMTTERRWPRFAAEAARLGVGSMIACSLPSEHGGGTAVLNLHATAPAAFDDAAVEMASIYSAHSCAALNQASLIASLRTAMVSRQVIGEATGILMERHRVGSRQAFGMLVQASQRLNIRLRHLAEYIVRTGQDPDQIRREDLPMQ